MRNRRILVGLCFLFTTQVLPAQRTDTSSIRNGVYGVFQRDERGKPVNPVAYYDTSGALRYHASYRKNKLEGPLVQYDTLGRKARTTDHKNGKPHGSDVFFYPDGSVQLERLNRKGKADGLQRSFHPNGTLEWSGLFRNGSFFGERIVNDSTGKPCQGECTTIFPLGRGYSTVRCIEGRPHGPVTAWHRNGNVLYTGTFNRGLPEGEFIYYDGKGDITRREFYKNGKAKWVVGIGIE